MKQIDWLFENAWWLLLIGIAVTLALSCIPTGARAHTDAQLRGLALRLCRYETQNIRHPAKWSHVGHDQELGWCHILPTTALTVNINPFRLDEPDIALEAATRWLWLCQRRGWRGDYWLAYCYNRGPDASRDDPTGHAYARKFGEMLEKK